MDYCPGCGAALHGEPKFCSECGAPIPHLAAEASASATPPSDSGWPEGVPSTESAAESQFAAIETGDDMSRIGYSDAPDGTSRWFLYEGGAFSIEGLRLSNSDEIRRLDEAGRFRWTSGEARTWFHSSFPSAYSPRRASREHPSSRGRANSLVALSITGVCAAAVLLAGGGALISWNQRSTALREEAEAEQILAAASETQQMEERQRMEAALGFLNNSSSGDFLGTLSEWGATYVNVGWAEDYPDQLLVTVSDTGMDAAYQFLIPTDRQRQYYRFTQGSTGNLPESVKNWNAHIGDNGDVVLDSSGY